MPLLLPLPPVRNPSSSARRPHPPWILYSWLGEAHHWVATRRHLAGCCPFSVEGL
ncbi:hypothetical protein AHAS_Ahas07G0141500 [Arachis hypogaea]